MNAITLPLWAEWTVALLLVLGGVFALLAAWGLVRLQDCFQRMHPPALGFTAASWCVALASVVYFSSVQGHLSLRSWVIVVVLAITVPVTTVLLARAALFRCRQQGQTGVPPALSPLDSAPYGEEQAS